MSARLPRSRPSGPRSAESSAGTDSAAPSDTARTTTASSPSARAAVRMAADSMSTASAPVADRSAALAAGVPTTVPVVTRMPVAAVPAAASARACAADGTASILPSGARTRAGTTRSPEARRGSSPPHTPAEITSGAANPSRQEAQRSERRAAPRPTGAMRRPGRP